MLIFRKAAAGELQEDSGLSLLAKQCEINVEEVGVGGAKNFFEAKVHFLKTVLPTIFLFLTWKHKKGLFRIEWGCLVNWAFLTL